MENMSPKKEFSWLRVIAVVIIVVLLGFFFLTWLSERGSRERARRAKCISNLKLIGLALKQYALDNHDSLPFIYDDMKPYQAFGLVHPCYVSSLDVFRCPSSKDKMWDIEIAHTDNNKDNSAFEKDACAKSLSYAYGHNKGKPWTENSSSDTRIAGDKYATEDYSKGDSIKRPSNHQTDGRNIVRLDGSARWDNNKGKLEADPETEYENSGHRESDQTGTDWWSDPPEKL